MRIYNTLTRKIDEFKPLNGEEVKVYTCGPTVYDYQHIGNWFTYIRYDLLIRTLIINGYKPNWIMNITDVGHLSSDQDSGEDKLVSGALREHKTAWEVADFYIKDFLSGLSKLNISQPTQIPRATEHIDDQINMISKLEEKGFTYTIDDGVYFDSSKFDDYSKLAKLDLQNQSAGKRVPSNPQKRNSYDFALWKFCPKDSKRDMQWDSPWGTGFPGWHIECSAMILKYLGATIDIHSGGIDHIPVHHTNEIAQSQSANGKPLANYWMHTNHIFIDDQKISKSLRNGVTLKDVVDEGYELEALRLLCLESHYRTQSKFGWDELRSASYRLDNYRALAVLQFQPAASSNISDSDLEDYINKIKEYMNEDLNTPQVMAILSEAADKLRDSLVSKTQVPLLKKLVTYIDAALGFSLSELTDITEDQKALISQRTFARNSKSWELSDQIRDKLLEQGIALSDRDQQTIWYKV
jgi:cysteinyl-tRNA synthetase